VKSVEQRGSATSPETFRLPTCYTLNLRFEKRVHFFRCYWTLRGGFDNIINHGNAALANGVIDPNRPSPLMPTGAPSGGASDT